jgi:hypothetical protein
MPDDNNVILDAPDLSELRFHEREVRAMIKMQGNRYRRALDCVLATETILSVPKCLIVPTVDCRINGDLQSMNVKSFYIIAMRSGGSRSGVDDTKAILSSLLLAKF